VDRFTVSLCRGEIQVVARRYVHCVDVVPAELRGTSTGEIVKVLRDRGSGLREDRPGLNRLIALVADGSVTVVRVTHEDRLARFGVGWLRRLFAVYGVTVEVLHPKKLGGRDELLEDFVALVTIFAGAFTACDRPRLAVGC
jgi:putative resolvase